MTEDKEARKLKQEERAKLRAKIGIENVTSRLLETLASKADSEAHKGKERVKAKELLGKTLLDYWLPGLIRKKTWTGKSAPSRLNRDKESNSAPSR